MTWFLIVLGIIAYLQIGYQIGRLRRRVYNNAEQYSDVTKRALFPMLGLFRDVGNSNESMLVHRCTCATDSHYCAFFAFAWAIYLIPAAIVGVIYLLYGLVEGPNRLIAFFAARRAAVGGQRRRTKKSEQDTASIANTETEPTDQDEERFRRLEERQENLASCIERLQNRLDGKEKPYR